MQTIRRHYRKAPITEALIGFGCELPKEKQLSDLLAVHEQLRADYPKRAEEFNLSFRLEAIREPPKGAATVDPPDIVGYRLQSLDGKRNVRLTLAEFVFGQLGPYDKWETFHAEAMRVWGKYESVLNPMRINRISVRFINRIDIPDPDGKGIDLDLYFRTAPRIAPELPQVMRTHFLRLELTFREPNGILVITQTPAQPPAPGLISTLFDIDAIVQNIDTDAEGAWKAVEELRDEKNAAFEASITDRARELFE